MSECLTDKSAQTSPSQHQRIIVTGANSCYFGSLMTLIGSLFKNKTTFDRIFVYNLGLSFLERWILKGIPCVSLREVEPFCPHYLDVGNFAWKTASIASALKEGGAICWLDAGIETLRPIDDLFATIEKDGYFYNITPFDKESCYILSLTQSATYAKMGASKADLENRFMCNAGISGFLANHPSAEIAMQAKRWAADSEIITGPRHSHRHDQSIYSILWALSKFQPQYWLCHVETVAPYPFLVPAQGTAPVSQEIVLQQRDLHPPYLQVIRNRNQFLHLETIPFIRLCRLRHFALGFLKKKSGIAVKSSWKFCLIYPLEVLNYKIFEPCKKWLSKDTSRIGKR
ncbi:TPA: hypothetical protein DDW35_10475 [Candidatus Sumerlaeota bacterium]|jgi:hypothetical protein|nr:hypothetical protein [Candidatus Sumerlaeota bacterium]